MTFDAATLQLSGTPPANFAGSLALRLSMSDGTAVISDDFALYVTGVNDAPVVVQPLPDLLDGADGRPLLQVDAPFTIPVPAGTFSDPDGDTLHLGAREAGKSSLPNWMTFDGSKFTCTAPASILDAQGVAQIDIGILASDGSMQASDVFTVRFGASPNEAPIAGNDGTFVTYAPQAIDIPVALLLENDVDPDGATLAIVSASGAAHGTVSLLTQGTAPTADDMVRYLPAAGYSGDDQFIYTVSDGERQSNAILSVRVDGSYSGYQQGTSGNDVVTATNGAGSTFFGGAGNDIITGANNGGSYAGGTSDDTLIARGHSLLEGNEGDDRLYGGHAADTLIGGSGDDLLFGGGGKDMFIFRSGDGSDAIMDFDAGRRTRQNFIARRHDRHRYWWYRFIRRSDGGRDAD